MPIDAEFARRLRAEVRLVGRRARTRRVFPSSLHVGQPGGVAVDLPALETDDVGFRVDLISMALDLLDEPDPVVWLSRCGRPDFNDTDLQWCAAATAALASRGWAPAFYVVTRISWRSPITDDSRIWTRQRRLWLPEQIA